MKNDTREQYADYINRLDLIRTTIRFGTAQDIETVIRQFVIFLDDWKKEDPAQLKVDYDFYNITRNAI